MARRIKSGPTHWLFSFPNITPLAVRVFLEFPGADAYEVEYIVSGAMILMRNVTGSFEKSLGKLAFTGNCFHLPHIEFPSFYITPKHGHFLRGAEGDWESHLLPGTRRRAREHCSISGILGWK